MKSTIRWKREPGELLRGLFTSPELRQRYELRGIQLCLLATKACSTSDSGKENPKCHGGDRLLDAKTLFLTCKTHRRRLRLDEKSSDESLGFVLPMNVNVSFRNLP